MEFPPIGQESSRLRAVPLSLSNRIHQLGHIARLAVHCHRETLGRDPRACPAAGGIELRAARAWSLEQTARVFQVTAATIASWGKRLDDHGPRALLRSPGPVNRFPDYVRAAFSACKLSARDWARSRSLKSWL